MNAKQSRQSKKKSAYYDRQFQVTIDNRRRRSARRQRRKVELQRRQFLKRLPAINEANRQPRTDHA